LCAIGLSVTPAAAADLWSGLSLRQTTVGVATEAPPYLKGNDTGGIIAWSPSSELQARELTDQFCARWGKYPRITGVHRQYGDYISFNCLWNPRVARYALPEVPVTGYICRTKRTHVHGRWEKVEVCG
jgi:hypothetical protein